MRSTEPLVRLLGQRLVRANLDNSVMLEVLTRRYYGNKGLSDVRSRDVAGCTFVIAEHVEPARVVTTAVPRAARSRLRPSSRLSVSAEPGQMAATSAWAATTTRAVRRGQKLPS